MRKSVKYRGAGQKKPLKNFVYHETSQWITAEYSIKLDKTMSNGYFDHTYTHQQNKFSNRSTKNKNVSIIIAFQPNFSNYLILLVFTFFWFVCLFAFLEVIG